MKVLLLDQIAKVNYKYSYSLANSLKNNNIDCILAIDKKEDNKECKCKCINLFNSSEKNVSKINKVVNYIKALKKIRILVNREKINLVHAQWFILSPIDYYYLRKMKKYGIKFVITIHDILPFNRKFYDYFFHKKIYGLADSIIVQANNNIERFNELFPKYSNKVSMIPHGNFLSHAEVLDKKIGREKLNLDNEKFVILFFGQIKKVKGVDILLRAFSKVCKNKENILLIIAGSVWKDDFASYQKIIDENNINDYVKTDIKYIDDDDIKHYYSACDVAILPYKDVYQSGVVQLCYAFKKAVIATKLPAFQNIVKEGETGFLAEVNNPDSLADAILRAYNSKDKLQSIADNGYKLMQENFSWEDIGRKVIKLYKK